MYFIYPSYAPICVALLLAALTLLSGLAAAKQVPGTAQSKRQQCTWQLGVCRTGTVLSGGGTAGCSLLSAAAPAFKKRVHRFSQCTHDACCLTSQSPEEREAHSIQELAERTVQEVKTCSCQVEHLTELLCAGWTSGKTSVKQR